MSRRGVRLAACPPYFWLELDAALSEDSLLVGVLDLAHLGDGVGKLDQGGVGRCGR